MTALALVGAQFGSEGKGVIAARLAWQFDAAVRTGGPNAGHSFFWDDVLYKMRQVPCAWVNPGCDLYVGAGAVVDPELLERELDNLSDHDQPRIVSVDPQAVLVRLEHHAAEKGIATTIGSTGEGVGAARISKIKRDGTAQLADDYQWGGAVLLTDVLESLYSIEADQGWIMLEGTQGFGLSIDHGIYPYVTSADTSAAQLAAHAGLPASSVQHTHLVARTFPIRVGGTSGPLADEITWDDVPAHQPERTTVTNKQRRIGRFNPALFRRAVIANDPCGVWLSFGDYVDPEIEGETDIDRVMAGSVGDFVRANIYPLGLRLLGVGTGGPRWAVAETGDKCDRRGAADHWSRPWPLS